MNIAKKSFAFILLLALTGLLSACTSHSGASLEGTSWSLISIESGNDLEPQFQAGRTTLTLEQGGRASGNAGCNSYGGSYKTKGDSITFHRLTSTLMACADPALMQQESAYLTALQTTGNFVVKDGTLVISYNDGQNKLIFEGPFLASTKNP